MKRLKSFQIEFKNEKKAVAFLNMITSQYTVLEKRSECDKIYFIDFEKTLIIMDLKNEKEAVFNVYINSLESYKKLDYFYKKYF